MLSDDGSQPRVPGGRRRPFASVLHRPGSPRVELPGVTGVPGQPGLPSEIQTPGSTALPTAATTGTRATVDASDVAIVVDRATKRFGSLIALQDLTLTVPFGTTLGIIGPSGAGKTTTIRLMTGGIAPTSGQVSVLGENPRHFRRQTRERIGYMPQLFVLYPDLTAEENVGFVASLFGMLWRRRRDRVREVLQLVDLWDARGRRASELSGGMQRRLELACALIHKPALLFLDEPTAGIDPLLRKTIWDELHGLRAEGRTLLITTQYVGEAEECDNVALIADGRLIALAPPEDLRRSAMGGEVVEIETTRAFDGAVLENVPIVRAVRQPGPRNIWVISDDAGAAVPALVDAVAAAGGDVVNAREYRPSFDEVFAELVNRSQAAAADGAPGDEAAGDAQAAAGTTH
jgi:ABC-2 type transport system ATP-binding protein